ncbi:sigma 54-interacting transcriptional regulator [Desulfitobacterium sp.]|uniref:sigma 54-interacting transcriptional regulator n=1 Tax=Desulfitobacterium sp. TaxID=49981 RepID=UPI002B759903|nr:sigma 54-interacting transcriptional regulator [Desulfitobacterium sp.]HVJ48857.1 sigma 54-interacting transcriptional regulator [Desulfitobacterium sp.]
MSLREVSSDLDHLDIFEAIKIGIIVTDREDKIEYCNTVVADYLGSKLNAILYHKITEFIPNSEPNTETAERFVNAERPMIKGRMILVNRFPLEKKRQKVGTVVILQDGSDFERLLSQLNNTQSSLEDWENIFEHAYDGVMVVDPKGIITRITNAYCYFLNVKQEDAIGKHCTEVLPNSRMEIVAQTGVAEIGEPMIITGKEALVMRLPLRENGKLVGAVGKVMFRDVQDLRTLAEKLDLLENKIKFYEKELVHYQRYRYTFSSIIGNSPAILGAKTFAEKAAAGKSTVLLLGESGTGKELFAHAIHAASSRNNKPFVRVNCGAIPGELLESELFGYEEGAFTGAKKGGKPGKFEIANSGTIFLDEIGDLPLAMQAKVLRVLQEKEVERVGSNQILQLDIRIIAATHRNLEKMVSNGEFRRDLYYRLNVFTINIPPLREREGDVILLSDYLLEKIEREMGASPKVLDRKVKDLIKLYAWPGNVRELQNALERTMNVAEGDRICIRDLPLYLQDREGGQSLKVLQPLAFEIAEAERKAILKALELTTGNKAKAADILGIHRTNLYRKMEKYGLTE